VQVLEYDFHMPSETWEIKTQIEIRKPIRVVLTPIGVVPGAYVERLKEDIMVGVHYFEEEMRRRTLYITFSPHEEIGSVHEPGSRGRLRHIFGDSMVNFYILSIFFSIGLFFVFGAATPIIMILFQSLLIFFSDRIVARIGDWKLTKDNPTLYLMQYHLDPDEMKNFEKQITKGIMDQIRTEIFAATFGVGREVTCDTTRQIFSRYGIDCRPENIRVKKIDVYDLVERASRLFGLPIPKISVSNTMAPNAAATGVSPGRATVMITTGAMVQLEDSELLSVLGHEMSHVKSRDPISLFVITSAEYLLRVYVFYPIVILLGFFYFLFALGGIYFIGKFFEARCDLESAMRTGSAEPMASALRKIGFSRLIFERSPSVRLMDWLSWDPHPPIYFRISRLEKIKNVKEIKHPFLTSVKDCIEGVIASVGSTP